MSRASGERKATVLDARGYAVREIRARQVRDDFVLELPKDALYTVIEQ